MGSRFRLRKAPCTEIAAKVPLWLRKTTNFIVRFGLVKKAENGVIPAFPQKTACGARMTPKRAFYNILARRASSVRFHIGPLRCCSALIKWRSVAKPIVFLIGSCSIPLLFRYDEVAQRGETISAVPQRRGASSSFACFCALVPYPARSTMHKWRSVARPILLRRSFAKHSVLLSASVALHSCSTLPKWRIVAEPFVFLNRVLFPCPLVHYAQVAQRGDTHSVAFPCCFSLHLSHSSVCIDLL